MCEDTIFAVSLNTHLNLLQEFIVPPPPSNSHMINQMGSGDAKVEIINTKGCSRLFVDITSPSFRGLQSVEPAMSPSSYSSSLFKPSTDGPFAGLVICVTGLSKEARKQVMDATKRLGGEYSSDLHPQCTHLVVESSRGRKFEHALKHGLTNGLFIVTLGWFVDSVRRNVRLSESLYRVKNVGENYKPKDDRKAHYPGSEKSCLPVVLEHAKQSDMLLGPRLHPSEDELKRKHSIFSGHSFYLDADISAELQKKVVEAASREGATLVNKWFVGQSATHVVCEGAAARKYIGHSSNLVTPLWVLKTVKENRLQRLVHLSADLARQVGIMIENVQSNVSVMENYLDTVSRHSPNSRIKANQEENQKVANLAKNGVRNRRGRRMQTCQTPIRPITPSSLLDSVCWSVSEPSSSASLYTDSFSFGGTGEQQTSVFYDANEDGKDSFVNFLRPLTESERNEMILKNHFLTVLFPVDRFSEMGPCSRTFFSDTGFTCLQLLDHIYAFYQENMSAMEIEVAIHTDSRSADRLRSVYSSKESAERGHEEFKRIDFLGSRKSFEMLKRVTGDNNSNVYELLLRA